MNDLASSIIKELRVYFSPLTDSVESPDDLLELFHLIGWDVKSIFGDELSFFLAEIQKFEKITPSENSSIEQPSKPLTEFASALEAWLPAIETIRRLPNLRTAVEPNILADLPKEILNALTIFYLHDRSPLIFNLLRLLTVIRVRDEDYVVDDDSLLVSRQEIPYLHFDKLNDIVRDPSYEIGLEYWPAGFPDLETTSRAGEMLFARIASVLATINVIGSVGSGRLPDKYSEEVDARLPGLLTLEREYFSSDVDDYVSFGTSIGLLSETDGGPGVYVFPFGESSISQSLDNWRLEFEMSSAADGLQITESGVEFLGENAASEFDAKIVLSKESYGMPDFLVGGSSGTRLEVRDIALVGKVHVDSDAQDYSMYAEFGQAKLVVKPDDGDGLIQNVFPADGFGADFDVSIGWSSKKGFHIRGNAGMDTTIPIGRTLGGIVTIDSIYLAVDAGDEGLTNTVAASIQMKIGPVEATLDRVGLEAKFSSTEDGGNLGPLNLDFGFKAPTSIGLSINTKGVVGGGFLQIDPPHYAGILHIDVKDKFSIMAIGVLTTELPDGKSGFSMLFQIVAEFSPIQLGLGFALTGVGGVVGINRKFHEENMRKAIQNHEFDLFPTEEPDFFKIIDTYHSVLPPMKGHHIFGPIVKIHWGGTVKLVEFEVGIFLQLGGPVQVLIVGRAWSVLPDEDTKILVLDFDVFGVIDFGDGRLEIEATLSPGSKFMGYDLDGQMALKADWKGSGKTFVMSVGGFHPRFKQIPIGFPALRRLQILAKKSGANITLQLYFAITTNSLQFGALLDISAKKSGFKIAGGGGFDALIIFNPFSFTVLIYFWVRVSKSWFSVGLDLELELTGPNPLRAKGYVKFSYGFGSKKVRFSKKFGEEKKQKLPILSPVETLFTELSNAEHLTFELPSWARAGVIYREGAESMADPLSDIVISQEVVPLNVKIDKFGGARLPESERKIDIEANVTADIVEDVETLFAPAQFIAMSDDQKLSSPAFTDFKSGLRLKSSYVTPQTSETRELVFETVLRESQFYSPEIKNSITNVNIPHFICLWAPDFEEDMSNAANWSLAGASLIHTHTSDSAFEAKDEYGAIGFDDSEMKILDNVATHSKETGGYSSYSVPEEPVTVSF